MSLEFLRQKFARISNIQQLATNVINRTVTIRPVDFEGSTISSGLHKLKPRYSKITCKRLANELIKRGVDPIEVGLPIQYANDSSKHVKTPDFAKQHPPSYRQACREFKYVSCIELLILSDGNLCANRWPKCHKPLPIGSLYVYFYVYFLLIQLLEAQGRSSKVVEEQASLLVLFSCLRFYFTNPY